MSPSAWHLVYRSTPGQTLSSRMDAIAAVIGGRLGATVTASAEPDPIAALATREGATRIVWASALDAAQAIGRGGAASLAMAQYKGDPFYRAMIVGRADKAHADWPRGARGTRMLFGPSTMLSQWVAPVAHLRAQGIDPMTFFAAEQVPAFNEIVPRVMRGEADYGATYSRAIHALLAKREIDPAALAIVWVSEPLPYDTLLIARGLDPALVNRLRNALLAVGEADRERLPPDLTGFSPALASDFDGVRAMAAQA